MREGYIKAVIQSNKAKASNIYEMKLKKQNSNIDSSKKVIEGFEGKPGQFYMIKGWSTLDPFLPRPISISNISQGSITFLYELKGKGTQIMSRLQEGNTLEILGPLGNGFSLDFLGSIAIVSGGIGIAPMVYLAKELKGNLDFYCGFGDESYYIDELGEHANNVFISTEDGSRGHKGFITEIFDPSKYDLVFTCGPWPMMEALFQICKGKVPLYMSMENRMACGIGACLGCTINTVHGYKRVCKDGPVFPGEEVVPID